MCKKFWQHSRFSWLFQLQWIVPFCKKNSSNGRNNACFEIKNSILPDKTEKISISCLVAYMSFLILALMTKRPSLIGKNCWWFQSPLKSYNFWFALWNFQKSLHDKTKFTKLYCFFFMSLIQHCILTWCWVLVPAHGPHYWLFTFSRLRFFFLKV